MKHKFGKKRRESSWCEPGNVFLRGFFTGTKQDFFEKVKRIHDENKVM